MASVFSQLLGNVYFRLITALKMAFCWHLWFSYLLKDDGPVCLWDVWQHLGMYPLDANSPSSQLWQPRYFQKSFSSVVSITLA